jgi:ribosome-interacting GTPase 1
MPANLSPEYMAAEEAYKAAKDPAERLDCLERMLRTIPKHKGTEKMQADLKRRIARTREGLERQSGKKGFGVKVDAEGAAQIAVVGAPNSGKSALVEVTTNARVEVGDHPFATRLPVPAMMSYENVQLQLVDLPPVSREYMEYWVPGIMRATAESALWVIDASDAAFGDRIDEVCAVLAERKVELCGADAPRSELRGVVCRLPTLVAAAKVDEPAAAEILPRLRERLEPTYDVLPVSALGDSDFSELARRLFRLNRIIRVFSKAPGKEPDRSRPFILHEGDTLMDFARKVHKDFAEKLRYARVWGEGWYDGQRVPRDQPLTDGDVIELKM